MARYCNINGRAISMELELHAYNRTNRNNM